MKYFDLGRHTRHVSTRSTEAQRWFDLGLNWSFGFNHEEAVKCFQKALEADPGCVMAHWGVAYALGPFYNLAWRELGGREAAAAIGLAHDHIGRARALAADATGLENRLVEALANIIHASPRCRAGVQLVRSATTTPHPTFSVAARRCAGRARRRPYTAGTPVTNFRQQERPAQMTVEKAFARAAGSEPAGRSDLKALLASFPPKEMTCWPVSAGCGGAATTSGVDTTASCDLRPRPICFAIVERRSE
jgi:hypothetical protein